MQHTFVAPRFFYSNLFFGGKKAALLCNAHTLFYMNCKQLEFVTRHFHRVSINYSNNENIAD
jgi:hypothetical protein